MRSIYYLLVGTLCLAWCQGCTPLMSIDHAELLEFVYGLLKTLRQFLA